MSPVSPLLQTIVYWPHREGGEAHCLARIYHRPDTAIVVLSEIRSNDRAVPLMLDLAGAANAVASNFSDLGIHPERVTWLVHHGAFSDYEPMEREEWAQTGLAWDGQQYSVDWANWKHFEPVQVEALRQSIELISVFEVLPSIGFADGRV